MATLPALNYISNAARTEGEVKSSLESMIASAKQGPDAGIAVQALTLVTDQITPADGASGDLTVDTEASAATDNLAQVLQTNLPDGSVVRLRNTNAARVVVVKHAAGGSGQLLLKTLGDFVLADPDRHWLILKRSSTSWKEIARFPAADLAPLLSKSGNYTTTVTDRGQFIDCTATLTLTLLASATAGKGFEQCVQCSGGITTIDPNGGETIGGAATLLLQRGDNVRFVSDGTNWQIVQRFSAQGGLASRWQISGLTTTNNGTDAVNDIDIAVGEAMSSDASAENRVLMRLTSTLTKQFDVVWAVGNGAGGLDTGTVGNNGYYVWLIMRQDTGVVDALFSLSSTAPTMPANYGPKRLIGYVLRAAAANVLMTTYETEGGGLELIWSTPTLDINLAATLTTTRRTDAVKVPLNFSVMAHLSVHISDGASGFVLIYCPDQTDLVPSQTAAPLTNFSHGGSGTDLPSASMYIRTSATGTIAARSTVVTEDVYRVATVGFTWARRN